jgi:hypothetical protein
VGTPGISAWHARQSSSNALESALRWRSRHACAENRTDSEFISYLMRKVRVGLKMSPIDVFLAKQCWVEVKASFPLSLGGERRKRKPRNLFLIALIPWTPQQQNRLAAPSDRYQALQRQRQVHRSLLSRWRSRQRPKLSSRMISYSISAGPHREVSRRAEDGVHAVGLSGMLRVAK